MTIKEFLKERIESYLELWATDIEETKAQLERATIYGNNIEWNEIDDDMTSYKNLEDLQLSFDSDWSDFVTMSPDFDEFSEEEQEEIKDSDEFQQTPIKVWDLI